MSNFYVFFPTSKLTFDEHGQPVPPDGLAKFAFLLFYKDFVVMQAMLPPTEQEIDFLLKSLGWDSVAFLEVKHENDSQPAGDHT